MEEVNVYDDGDDDEVKLVSKVDMEGSQLEILTKLMENIPQVTQATNNSSQS